MTLNWHLAPQLDLSPPRRKKQPWHHDHRQIHNITYGKGDVIRYLPLNVRTYMHTKISTSTTPQANPVKQKKGFKTDHMYVRTYIPVFFLIRFFQFETTIILTTEIRIHGQECIHILITNTLCRLLSNNNYHSLLFHSM